MKAATAMKEALDAVRDPGCTYEGPGVCRCCEARVQPANDCLAGLDNATVARMDWVAALTSAERDLLVEAIKRLALDKNAVIHGRGRMPDAGVNEAAEEARLLLALAAKLEALS